MWNTSNLVLVASGTYLWGQLGASTIRGTITDPSGAAVAGATVTIINLETNLTRTQTTQANGNYSFELIPPGDTGNEAGIIANVPADKAFGDK